MQGLGNVMDALADCGRARALDPGFVRAATRMARLLTDVRRHDAAERILASLLEAPAAEAAAEGLGDAGSGAAALTATERGSVAAQLAEARASARRQKTADHFALLALPRQGCEDDAVKKAYRKAALRYHPDKAAQACRVALTLPLPDGAAAHGGPAGGAASLALPVAPAGGAGDVEGRMRSEAGALFNMISAAHEELADAHKRRRMAQLLDIEGGIGGGSHAAATRHHAPPATRQHHHAHAAAARGTSAGAYGGGSGFRYAGASGGSTYGYAAPPTGFGSGYAGRPSSGEAAHRHGNGDYGTGAGAGASSTYARYFNGAGSRSGSGRTAGSTAGAVPGTNAFARAGKAGAFSGRPFDGGYGTITDARRVGRDLTECVTELGAWGEVAAGACCTVGATGRTGRAVQWVQLDTQQWIATDGSSSAASELVLEL
eukprot:361895-Chlamydomonas_euryale.AAC.7